MKTYTILVTEQRWKFYLHQQKDFDKIEMTYIQNTKEKKISSFSVSFPLSLSLLV